MDTLSGAELICRACGGPHCGEKFDLLESPALSELYILLSGTQFHEDDSLPKQLCVACYLRVEDFNRFQEMCASSYKGFMARVSKYIISTEIDSFEIIIRNEKLIPTNQVIAPQIEAPQFLPSESSADLPAEEIDFYSNVGLTELENVNAESGTARIEQPNDDGVDRKQVSVLRSIKNCVVKINRKSRPIVCQKCPKKFWNKENYEAHLANHRKKKVVKDPNLTQPIPCEKCPIKFWQRERYEAHKIKHDSLICTNCDKKFRTKKLHGSHMLKVHGITTPAPTSKPSNSEKTRPAKKLAAGNVPNEQKKYNVNSMNSTKSSAYDNNNMILKTNIVIKSECRYECNICHLRFRIPGTLKAHKKRHKAKKNIKFVCKHCGVTRTTEHLLMRHMNLHTRENVFRCETCLGVFFHNSNLRRHIRVVHEGIRAFKCQKCGKSFAEGADLRRHQTKTKCLQN